MDVFLQYGPLLLLSEQTRLWAWVSGRKGGVGEGYALGPLLSLLNELPIVLSVLELLVGRPRCCLHCLRIDLDFASHFPWLLRFSLLSNGAWFSLIQRFGLYPFEPFYFGVLELSRAFSLSGVLFVQCEFNVNVQEYFLAAL